jgi:hypothetical protein
MTISDETREALAARRKRGHRFPEDCGLDTAPLDVEARELAEDYCLAFAAFDVAADCLLRRAVATLLARALATIDEVAKPTGYAFAARFTVSEDDLRLIADGLADVQDDWRRVASLTGDREGFSRLEAAKRLRARILGALGEPEDEP